LVAATHVLNLITKLQNVSPQQNSAKQASDTRLRPSVCLSHGWISQKRLKLGWCNFHQVAPWL